MNDGFELSYAGMPESLIIESVAENQRLNEDDGSGHGNDNGNVAEQVNTM